MHVDWHSVIAWSNAVQLPLPLQCVLLSHTHRDDSTSCHALHRNISRHATALKISTFSLYAVVRVSDRFNGDCVRVSEYFGRYV